MSRLLTAEGRREKFETKWSEWKLIDFNGTNGPCKVQHKCGNIKDYETYFNVEKRGPICQACNEDKRNWYYEINEQVGDLLIINRRVGNLQEYQYRCLKCGFDGSKPAYFKGKYINEYWVLGRGLKSGNKCACCRGLVVQPGINDVATTDPEIVQYFANIEDANRYSRGSDFKIKSKCPICGCHDDKLIAIGNLVNEGRNCLNCGKAISYPEKMMYFLLKEIGVPFEMHKVFEWSKDVYDDYDQKNHKREYDFYIPPINAIIETHGSQHYRLSFAFNNNINLKTRQRIDNEKMVLAKQYCSHYIVVDCKNSNKSYIKNSIIQSELSNLLDLSNIDWDKISKNALNGVAKLVVEDKKKNPYKITTELAEEYGVHYSTVITWLKKAGIYNTLESKKIAGLKRSFPVYSPELDKAFRSTRLASEEVGVGTKTINSAFNPNIPGQKHAGRHPITGERLTWERWTLDQYEEWCKTNNKSNQSLCNFTN